MGYGGRRDPSEYVFILTEIYFDKERNSKGVRPIPGQAFPTSMKIECSKAVHQLPIGTKVKLRVVATDKEGSREFLYSSYKWPHEIVGD